MGPGVRLAREGGSIASVWEDLCEPWRLCVESSWEAFRAGSLPIGAAVTDSGGRVLSTGRNRIHERSGPPGTVFGHKLAHAELNALLGANEPRSCVLYTTKEPCPLCVGAARMADVSEVRYASREPRVGSAAMFRTVPYLRKGNVRVIGLENGRLEAVLVALQVERFLRLRPAVLARFLRAYGRTMPEATEAGERAHRSGLLQTMSRDAAPASEVVRALDREMRPLA